MSDDRPLMSPKEVADRLKVSLRKTHYLLKAGDIPSLKIGHARRVKPADVDAYVARLGKSE